MTVCSYIDRFFSRSINGSPGSVAHTLFTFPLHARLRFPSTQFSSDMKSTFFALAAAAAAGSASAQSPAYGQCGGSGWSGATTCVSGYTCQKSNDYYAQCVPGTASTAKVTTIDKASTTTTRSGSSPSPSSGSGSGSGSGKVQYAGVNVRILRRFGFRSELTIMSSDRWPRLWLRHRWHLQDDRCGRPWPDWPRPNEAFRQGRRLERVPYPCRLAIPSQQQPRWHPRLHQLGNLR